jgi:hypothetical protein
MLQRSTAGSYDFHIRRRAGFRARLRGWFSFSFAIPGGMEYVEDQDLIFPAPQFPARFSANDASPSDASAVWRFCACSRTSRA